MRSLREELDSLRAQVAPVAEQAAERQATAAHTCELTRQFQDQFKRAAGSVWDLCSRFKIQGPYPPISYTTAHCLHFFSQFVDELSAEVGSLETVLDIECRQLLQTAVTHAFAMIAHIEPSFNLKRLKDPLPPAKELSLVNSVQEEASAFVEEFSPEEKKEGTRAGGDGDADVDIEDGIDEDAE